MSRVNNILRGVLETPNRFRILLGGWPPALTLHSGSTRKRMNEFKRGKLHIYSFSKLSQRHSTCVGNDMSRFALAHFASLWLTLHFEIAK